MNFPLQYPLFQFFYWLVNTPGVGGAIVMIVGGICSAGAFFMLRGIALAGKDSRGETYSYPQQSFHTPDEEPLP